ncbi:MAG: HNH endonuclease [Bdellovibrionia bacterium]
MHALTALRALLLNSSYEPMRVVSWQKALILWIQEKVEILEYHPVFAKSVRSSFQLPSVLRLREYVRPRNLNGPVRFCRENVYIRDNYTCQYCGHQYPLKQLTLDHVLPASQNGAKSWTNIVTACRGCNQKKANRTPQKANMTLLSEPRAPNWLPTLDLEIRASGQVPPGWDQYLRLKLG